VRLPDGGAIEERPMWYPRKRSKKWYERALAVVRNRSFQVVSATAAVAGLIFGVRRRRAARAMPGSQVL
jgi:hypothetical protein